MNKSRSKKKIIFFVLIVIIFILVFRPIKKFIKEYRFKQEINVFLTKNKEELKKFYISDGSKSKEAYIAHGGGLVILSILIQKKL